MSAGDKAPTRRRFGTATHKGDFAMIRILAAAALTALIAAPAMAGPGLQLQGTSMNGWRLNGIEANGLKFNGLKFNGLKFNGSATGDALAPQLRSITLGGGATLSMTAD